MRSRSRLYAASLVAILATTGLSAGAAAPASPAGEKDPHSMPVFSFVLKAGLTPRFLRRDDALGLDVWYIVEQGVPGMFYVTANGCCIIDGKIYGQKDGGPVPLTELHRLEATTLLAAQGIFPEAAASQSVGTAPAVAEPAVTGPKLVAALENTRWTEIGKPSAPMVYAVVDPECPYCHGFWELIRPEIDAGRIRVRLVITGALSPLNGGLSERNAASILASAVPGDAWDAHTPGTQVAPPDGANAAKGVAAVAQNDEFRKNVLVPARLTQVPLIVSRNNKGEIGFHRGIDDKGLTALLANLASL
jgi:thiol:disulfide interchange protein DsbG